MEKKKEKKVAFKALETASATRFNLLLICPSVPPFVYAALFVPSFPSIWW